MLFSIEETDTGYRVDFPDHTQKVVVGDEDAERNLGAALISGLAKVMPAKLTLRVPLQTVKEGDEEAPKDADGKPAVPKFDLKDAKTLADIEGRVSEYVEQNAVALGKSGLSKLQTICKDTNFRGKRRFAS